MGNGRSDIVMEDNPNRRVVIIEVKRSRDFDDLEADCERAICQIQENNYAWPYSISLTAVSMRSVRHS